MPVLSWRGDVLHETGMATARAADVVACGESILRELLPSVPGRGCEPQRRTCSRCTERERAFRGEWFAERGGQRRDARQFPHWRGESCAGGARDYSVDVR